MWTRESSGDGGGVKKKPNSNDKHRSKWHETYYLIHKLEIEFSKQLSVLVTFLWSQHMSCGGDRIRRGSSLGRAYQVTLNSEFRVSLSCR